MSYAYKILPSPLHSTADAAIEWFLTNWGLNAGLVKVEEPVHPDVGLRPTFSIQTPDFHTLCIEVSESSYGNHLAAFAVGCMSKGLPVKLFVATPRGTNDPNYASNLRAAQEAGVGILHVDGTSGNVAHNALSLSLMGVRAIKRDQYPKKYRHGLFAAEQAFRDGTPDKACSLVYDEIEALFRRITVKASSKGWWANPSHRNPATYAWAKLIGEFESEFDRGLCPCAEFRSPAFNARILGVTGFRNDTGHKPKSQRALIRRDEQLRTRFESGVDLLKDLITAAAPLKV